MKNKKTIFFILFAALYLVVIYIIPRSKNVILHDDETYSQISETYEAKYNYITEDGTERTIVSTIYPPNPNLPKNDCGTIREQAAAQIKRALNDKQIKIPDDFEEEILIIKIYK